MLHKSLLPLTKEIHSHREAARLKTEKFTVVYLGFPKTKVGSSWSTHLGWHMCIGISLWPLRAKQSHVSSPQGVFSGAQDPQGQPCPLASLLPDGQSSIVRDGKDHTVRALDAYTRSHL